MAVRTKSEVPELFHPTKSYRRATLMEIVRATARRLAVFANIRVRIPAS